MSNIDANLANKAITIEHLNYLPPQASSVDLPSLPERTSPFPFHPKDSRFHYTKSITPTVLTVCRFGFPDETGQFPITPARMNLYTKYHVKFKCTIGSQHSGNEYALNRRDDSYIWWNTEGDRRRYGQVVLFAEAHTWQPIAIVKPSISV